MIFEEWSKPDTVFFQAMLALQDVGVYSKVTFLIQNSQSLW